MHRISRIVPKVHGLCVGWHPKAGICGWVCQTWIQMPGLGGTMESHARHLSPRIPGERQKVAPDLISTVTKYPLFLPPPAAGADPHPPLSCKKALLSGNSPGLSADYATVVSRCALPVSQPVGAVRRVQWAWSR